VEDEIPMKNRAADRAGGVKRSRTETYAYRVGLLTAANTDVVINEIMAANIHAFADPQGDYDDWIELHNLTNQEVDLTGRYLTDDPTKPRQWPFPSGTRIPAHGFLIVWADEDGKATAGLHANFKLASGGEQVLLVAEFAGRLRMNGRDRHGPHENRVYA
jgi:hypothetical protein